MLSDRYWEYIEIHNTNAKTQIQIYKNTNINENQGGSQQGNNAIIQKTLLAGFGPQVIVWRSLSSSDSRDLTNMSAMLCIRFDVLEISNKGEF